MMEKEAMHAWFTPDAMTKKTLGFCTNGALPFGQKPSKANRKMPVCEGAGFTGTLSSQGR
ncbi:hypothetical protein [Comamonas sp. 4034]|uniref:hypothetical protein n=1 Tax=Comamonas sp. 4034 TaxID=3156455 RepID=UPI003D25F802